MAIQGATRRDDGGYNLEFEWRYVPNEIGERFPFRKTTRGGVARIEDSGGVWRVTEVFAILDVPFGLDDR